jgi:hypothetical protein
MSDHDELVRSVSSASRRIWALSAPEHGMMMVRAYDAERIMREEILRETFPPAASEKRGEGMKKYVCQQCLAELDEKDVEGIGTPVVYHVGVEPVSDGHGGVNASPFRCGPVVASEEGNKRTFEDDIADYLHGCFHGFIGNRGQE